MAEHIDQSTAPLDEKLRRFLLALAKPDAVHFYGDGFPKPTIASEAYAFLADMLAGRLIVTAAGVSAFEVCMGCMSPDECQQGKRCDYDRDARKPARRDRAAEESVFARRAAKTARQAAKGGAAC